MLTRFPRRFLTAALMTSLAAACGGGEQPDDVVLLSDGEARAAIVTELVTPPERRSGTVRFAIYDIAEGRTESSVEGVADYDQQRYLSRLELNRPDVVASYDVAVVGGFRYEKLLSISSAGAKTPSFKPTWSSAESWAPEKEAYRSIPYLPMPFVGDHYFDVRQEEAGLAEARQREAVDAVIVNLSRMGTETHRGDQTTHYKLTFDRDRARQALSDALARGAFAFPPAAPASEEVDVWIDDQGRIRRYVRVLSSESRREHELWDFGKPNPVSIPNDLRAR